MAAYNKSALKKIPFIFTSVHASRSDITDKNIPQLSLQRMSVLIEAKKELDNKLRSIPGGNLELIGKLYELFDEAIMDELETANKFMCEFECSNMSYKLEVKPDEKN